MALNITLVAEIGTQLQKEGVTLTAQQPTPATVIAAETPKPAALYPVIDKVAPTDSQTPKLYPTLDTNQPWQDKIRLLHAEIQELKDTLTNQLKVMASNQASLESPPPSYLEATSLRQPTPIMPTPVAAYSHLATEPQMPFTFVTPPNTDNTPLTLTPNKLEASAEKMSPPQVENQTDIVPKSSPAKIGLFAQPTTTVPENKSTAEEKLTVPASTKQAVAKTPLVKLGLHKPVRKPTKQAEKQALTG